MKRYDVEMFEDGWWFMYPRTGDPYAVDLGHARTGIGRRLAIAAAVVRRWWRDWRDRWES